MLRPPLLPARVVQFRHSLVVERSAPSSACRHLLPAGEKGYAAATAALRCLPLPLQACVTSVSGVRGCCLKALAVAASSIPRFRFRLSPALPQSSDGRLWRQTHPPFSPRGEGAGRRMRGRLAPAHTALPLFSASSPRSSPARRLPHPCHPSTGCPWPAARHGCGQPRRSSFLSNVPDGRLYAYSALLLICPAL
jgi:hypothetical protein